MKCKPTQIVIISIAILQIGIANPEIHTVVENSDSIGLYNKFELTIDLSASFTNPFDYDQISLRGVFTSPSAEKDTVDGFYYQDYTIYGPTALLIPNDSPIWKMRFAPDEIGTWTYEIFCIDSTGTATYPSQTFICVSSENSGFVRKSETHFLKFDDNTKFFAIGENIGWYGSKTIYDYRDWMDALSSNGGNYFRIWMCSWAFAIEWKDTGLGNYQNRQNRAFQLDWVVEYARQRGMYIQICLNNHGQLSSFINPEWSDNPYNAKNGGPCQQPWQFFTNSTAKNYYKQRMRYIVARWGYATSILSWELFNEVNLTDNFSDHRTENILWHDEMTQYLKNVDINNHLVTTSYSDELYEPSTWNLSNVDYTQIHHYATASDVQSVHHSSVNHYLEKFAKPTIIGEFGFPSSDWSVDNDPDGIDLHNSLWASVVSGAFGTASTWWWDYYIDAQALYYHFTGVANFISTIDLLSQDFTSVIPECYSETKVDLYVSSGFSSWAKAPENNFTIQPNGLVSPPATKLGKYLYGASWHTELRNPPTFHVNYTKSGEFKIVTGDVSTSPTIEIWLDGVLVLSQPGSTNTTYSITVNAGEHDIFVDNQGTDWIEILEFIFTDYAPAIRSFALKGSTETIGWVQNRDYNWKYVRDVGIPNIIDDGTITLSGLANDGLYRVEWYSCSSGTTISIDTASAFEGSIVINVPPIQWDYAYKLTYQSDANIVFQESMPKSFVLGQNFPNPFNAETMIPYDISKSGLIEISIYDVTGKRIRRLVQSNKPPGTYREVWDGKDDEGNTVPSSTYLYQLKVDGNIIKTRRMTLAK